MAGCATHLHDTLEAEDVESLLTTPPSSPVPMEEDSVLVGFRKVAERFRISYTHNRVSGHIFITYFVEVFFVLVLLLLSGWWNTLLLQPVQKGDVHILPCCA